jgi:protein TorT
MEAVMRALVILDPVGDRQGSASSSSRCADNRRRLHAGTGVTAEAAVGILRSRNLEKKVQIVAFYLTPGVCEGIQKGRIMAAPADSMVIQGRIAIDQAVRLLEGKDVIKHVGPKIFVVDEKNANTISRDAVLAPTTFKPVFQVD